MKLVIVESPNKCKTISKYLGEDYYVIASKGHLRDLATSGHDGLGIDVNNNFKPNYIIDKTKKSLVSEILKYSKKADEVILATDPDREGEAIAWHLADILNLDINKTKRLEFHEITRNSIIEAIKQPRLIDMNLVNSQESRRIIDRVIGFKLSKLLQNKIKSRSAGRVQSATLKLICDHERKIEEFIPEEYWTLKIDIKKDDDIFSANYYKLLDENFKLSNKDDNNKVVSLINDKVIVKSIKSSNKKIESKPPFTTSTLQQEAYHHFSYSTKKTASLAQQLYEGIEINGEHVGLITYSRTDSTQLSTTFIQRAKNYISEAYGEEYIGYIKNAKQENAQNAHEAIRPTSNHRTPDSVKEYLTPSQYKLYKLIYERAIGSLMSAKKEEITTIIVECNGVSFKFDGKKVIFDGYTRLCRDISKVEEKSLPTFKEGDCFDIVNIENKQEFSKPPGHYSEASIVKLMEEKGIGRPSTYATTISTLVQRGYVTNKGGSVIPTEQGKITIQELNKYFPELIDVKYTASLEKELDEIQEGNESRIDCLTNFYSPFSKKIEELKDKMPKLKDKKTGEICPICGSDLVYKKGRYGEFIGCSDFPKCKYIKKEQKVVEETGELCPECGHKLVYRYDKRKRKFIGCSDFPKCKFVKIDPATSENDNKEHKCPNCDDGILVKKNGKYSSYYECSNFPKCKTRVKTIK